MRCALAPVPLVITLALAACTPPPPPPGAAGPVEAVQDFSAAIARGDSAAAWALLSSRTQQEADALARAAHATGTGPETGRQMLFSSAIPLGAQEARRLSGDADTAQVEAGPADGGAKATFHVVHEGGVWKLDLDLSTKG